MDFDQLLTRHVGTTDLSALSQPQLLAGIDRLRAALGAEAEDRLAIWCLLYMLGGAPDPDEAFDDEEEREAARDFAESIDDLDEE